MKIERIPQNGDKRKRRETYTGKCLLIYTIGTKRIILEPGDEVVFHEKCAKHYGKEEWVVTKITQYRPGILGMLKNWWRNRKMPEARLLEK